MIRFAVLAFIVVCHGAALAKSFPEALDVIQARVLTNLSPKAPGLSVAIGHEERIVWSAGFGFADLEKKKRVTSRTLFRIGSVSKPLTAVGLMLLVEQNRLDLDADIRKYLPDFPDKGAAITSRQLAGHLAGIRHYRGTEFLMNKPFATVRDSLKIFENDPLLSRPGEKYSYSSYGYNLLSAVMESAAKEEFLAYMQKAVFLPLKMTNTLPDRANTELPDRTQFYDAKPGGRFEVAATVDNSYKWAGGGFLSTPEDLVCFGFALMKPGFLREESLAIMFKSQTTRDGKPTGYGIGWSIRLDEGHRILMHTGGSVGGTSVLMLFPDSRVVLAMTANCTTSPFDKNNLEAFTAEFAGSLTKPRPLR